jgi:hypothetical protein
MRQQSVSDKLYLQPDISHRYALPCLVIIFYLSIPSNLSCKISQVVKNINIFINNFVTCDIECSVFLLYFSFLVCFFFDKLPQGRPLRQIMCHPGFEPWAGALPASSLCHCAMSPSTFLVYFIAYYIHIFISI